MKKIILFLLVILIFAYDAKEVSTTIKTYTLEEISRLSGGTFSVNVLTPSSGHKNLSFNDEFPEYIDQYSLTEDEESIVGKWQVLEYTGGPSPVYRFFPNKLFLGSTGVIEYKKGKSKYS